MPALCPNLWFQKDDLFLIVYHIFNELYPNQVDAMILLAYVLDFALFIILGFAKGFTVVMLCEMHR